MKGAQGHAFEVISFSFENTQTMSMHIVDHTSCVACTMRLIGHPRPLHCTYVRDSVFIHDFHIAMPHDIYALCVASSSSYMPCPFAYHMLDLITSHMLNNCSFYCVEYHTIFTTHYARYAWIVLHLTHVFRHFILFGVVNDSYDYRRPFIEQFMHALLLT